MFPCGQINGFPTDRARMVLRDQSLGPTTKQVRGGLRLRRHGASDALHMLLGIHLFDYY